MHEPYRVVVLGAGITGLTAAFELSRLAKKRGRRIEVTVLESSSRAGGKILTERADGLILEGGPDSFLTAKPYVLELVSELGIADELVASNPKSQTVYVYSRGKLRRLPAGMSLIIPRRIWPFLSSNLLSWRGKLRMAAEPFIPRELGDQDESLAGFVRRRLGPEALELIAAPLLAGIYAADPEKMSLQSTFPQFREEERKGSLLKDARKPEPLPPGQSLFMTLKGGLSRLTDTLLERLPPGSVRLNRPVEWLSRKGSSWLVRAGGETLEAAAVISALPAHALAGLCEDLDFELSAILREIRFVSTATVSLAYDAASFPAVLDGFGFLVPRGEGRQITAATYTSTKFPGRVPAGQVLIRAFVGADGVEELAAADPPVIVERVQAELAEILRLGPVKPRLARLSRWPQANPQYHVGHGLRLKRVDSCLKGLPGLFLAGASFRGVGLPDCVLSGRHAAAKTMESLMLGISKQASMVRV